MYIRRNSIASISPEQNNVILKRLAVLAMIVAAILIASEVTVQPAESQGQVADCSGSKSLGGLHTGISWWQNPVNKTYGINNWGHSTISNINFDTGDRPVWINPASPGAPRVKMWEKNSRLQFNYSYYDYGKRYWIGKSIDETCRHIPGLSGYEQPIYG